MGIKYGLLKDFGINVTEFSAIHELLKYSSDAGIPVKSDGSMFWITRISNETVKKEDPIAIAAKVLEESGAVKDADVGRMQMEIPPEHRSTKQPRYQGKSGEDLIDRYTSRYGKKDEPLIEAKKLQDYANRLVQYEENLIKEEVRAMEPSDFGWALRMLKNGKKVRREEWNGKGMYITLIPAGNARHQGFDMQDCIGMKTVNNLMQPGWLASQPDMLAEDWMIVE